MKVKDLVKELQKFDPEAEIWVQTSYSTEETFDAVGVEEVTHTPEVQRMTEYWCTEVGKAIPDKIVNLYTFTK